MNRFSNLYRLYTVTNCIMMALKYLVVQANKKKQRLINSDNLWQNRVLYGTIRISKLIYFAIINVQGRMLLIIVYR